MGIFEILCTATCTFKMLNLVLLNLALLIKLFVQINLSC